MSDPIPDVGPELMCERCGREPATWLEAVLDEAWCHECVLELALSGQRGAFLVLTATTKRRLSMPDRGRWP